MYEKKMVNELGETQTWERERPAKAEKKTHTNSQVRKIIWSMWRRVQSNEEIKKNTEKNNTEKRAKIEHKEIDEMIGSNNNTNNEQ